MEPFQRVTSIPTPFLRDNVDTDVIIPAEWLKTVSRSGLAKGAFSSIRTLENGDPDPESVFNQPAYKDSQILVAGDNFGCGSSREHAAWALADLGYRCVIAPDFADIFASNAFKNGILTISLDADIVAELAAEGEAGRALVVDLDAQTVTRADGQCHPFTLDPFRRRCLLEGLDEVGLTLQNHGPAIAAFEERQKLEMPWLYRG
ncbi:3-isopropylmalate dehydratase small subunit [Iodidimonas muriae]|uniref:3-isopropylmalate dehydratase small subunit n=1 Tax=Iodidimonas muriae TaxID=261467 RepID=A0ABQ2LG57_9PROT|nr:3-isopropylmalate dehydratase small subunit [Kordiimonadales bacterium JCM 17843]GGO16517.1 3-isopropylmalate dehydratase small subunit [Iodidimonas muriae]